MPSTARAPRTAGYPIFRIEAFRIEAFRIEAFRIEPGARQRG